MGMGSTHRVTRCKRGRAGTSKDAVAITKRLTRGAPLDAVGSTRAWRGHTRSARLINDSTWGIPNICVGRYFLTFGPVQGQCIVLAGCREGDSVVAALAGEEGQALAEGLISRTVWPQWQQRICLIVPLGRGLVMHVTQRQESRGRRRIGHSSRQTKLHADSAYEPSCRLRRKTRSTSR